ncbi:hypothetical protein KC330_g90 [Hortaea werneckii]|nr:hypothetical protein KC330_g90 [Hortaea werneckii]
MSIVMPPSKTTSIRLGERVSFPHHEVTVEAPNTGHAQEVFNVNLPFRDCEAAQQKHPIRLSVRVSYPSENFYRNAGEHKKLTTFNHSEIVMPPSKTALIRLGVRVSFLSTDFKVPRRRAAIGLLQTRETAGFTGRYRMNGSCGRRKERSDGSGEADFGLSATVIDLAEQTIKWQVAHRLLNRPLPPAFEFLFLILRARKFAFAVALIFLPVLFSSSGSFRGLSFSRSETFCLPRFRATTASESDASAPSPPESYSSSLRPSCPAAPAVICTTLFRPTPIFLFALRCAIRAKRHLRRFLDLAVFHKDLGSI